MSGRLVFVRNDLHDVLRRVTVAHEVDHDARRSVHVMEEVLEAYTEIVQARLTVRGLDESILRAFSMAGETNIAIEAILREDRELVLAELVLLGSADDLLAPSSFLWLTMAETWSEQSLLSMTTGFTFR